MCVKLTNMCAISSIVVLLAVCQGSFGIVDYCAQNTFMTNNTWLQLNKEASSFEYAIDQHFKGVHCCAKGYRSIEWYKDGRAYPWPGGVSNFILYPESANQTIYTGAVTPTDTGNYTCLLRNDTHIRSHTIHLQVFEKVPDAPRTTFVPAPQQEVELGKSVRLFCEAFVGRVNLPDAHNDASWRRVDQNGTQETISRSQQEIVPREDGETVGVYLVINKVTKEDYGEYVCRISKPDNYIEMSVQLTEKIMVDHASVNAIPLKKMSIIAAIILLLVLTIVVLNIQYGLTLRVRFKDRFGPLEVNDGKMLDVMICYSQKDADIVLGVLLPKLESKYHYRCGCKEFSSNVNNWHTEMSEAARKSRRIMVVMSPSCLNDNWDAGTIYQGMKQLLALGLPLSCIALKPLPTAEAQLKNNQGETLASILRTIHVVNWDRSSDDRFWLALRLHLPAVRFQAPPNAEDVSLGAEPNSTRLNCNFHESLEILV